MSLEVHPAVEKGIDMQMVKDVIAWIGTAIGIGLNITPAVLFYKIFRKIEKYNIVPESMLIFNILCSQLWACYWLRQNAFVPTVSSGIGTGLSILFAWIYLYVFFEGKPLYFLFSFLLVADLVGQFYYALMYIIPLEYVGTIAMVVNIINYAAPGQNIIKVIKEGNYKLIPIVTTVFGAMCSVSWFTFGVLQKDWNCIIPNTLGMLFSAINIITWTVFYCKAGEEKKEKEKVLIEDGVELKENQV